MNTQSIWRASLALSILAAAGCSGLTGSGSGSGDGSDDRTGTRPGFPGSGTGDGGDALDPGSKISCFYGDDDSEVPAGTIEHVVETLDGSEVVHVRLTLDPHFVDNSYGVESIGWGNRGHRWTDLVKSDHAQLLLRDGAGNLAFDFRVDYITEDASAPSGYSSLGVLGGDGTVTTGDPGAIVKTSTSQDKNLNARGYASYVPDSPASDENFSPNPAAPEWDYRVVYEAWVETAAFGSAGFGSVEIEYIHASPSKTGQDTVVVEPEACPPDWGCTDPDGCEDTYCNDPDGCEGGDGSGGDDGGDECSYNRECASGSICEDGYCVPDDGEGGGSCSFDDECGGGADYCDGGFCHPCNDPDGCEGGDGGPGSCTYDIECPTGEYCQGGYCAPDGTDCNDPDGCDDGSGGGNTCDGPAECPSGEYCVGGFCTPDDGYCNDPDGCDGGGGGSGGECDRNGDCASGDICKSGYCVPDDGSGGTCVYDSECSGDGAYCSGGFCHPCNDPDGCEDGKGGYGSCLYDVECGSGRFCLGGFCSPDPNTCTDPDGCGGGDGSDGGACNTSNDCSSSEICLGGFCSPDPDACTDPDGCDGGGGSGGGTCTLDSECLSSEFCEGGFCVPDECSIDDDCSPGEFCSEAGSCKPVVL